MSPVPVRKRAEQTSPLNKPGIPDVDRGHLRVRLRPSDGPEVQARERGVRLGQPPFTVAPSRQIRKRACAIGYAASEYAFRLRGVVVVGS